MEKKMDRKKKIQLNLLFFFCGCRRFITANTFTTAAEGANDEVEWRELAFIYSFVDLFLLKHPGNLEK